MAFDIRKFLIFLLLIGFLSGGVGGAIWTGERLENDARDRWLEAGKNDAVNMTDTILSMLSEAESALRAVAARLDHRKAFSPQDFDELVKETETWNLNIEFETVAFAQRVLRGQRPMFEDISGGELTTIGVPQIRAANNYESYAVRLTSDERGWFRYNADLSTHSSMDLVVQTAYRIPNQVIMGPSYVGQNSKQYLLVALGVSFAGQPGVLVATINLTDFFMVLQNIFLPPGLNVRLVERDNEARAEVLVSPIIGSTTPPASAVATELIRITKGHAKWDLSWDIMPNYRNGVESRFAQAVQLGGSALSILITVLMGFFAFQNIRITRLVGERTEKIRMTMEKADAAEKLLSKAFQSSPALFAISSPEDGRLIEVNEAWSSVTGYRREDALQKTVSELNYWKNLEERAAFVEQIKSLGIVRNYETAFRSKSGAVRDILLSGELIDYQDKACVLAVGQDITDRKEIERLKSEFVSTVSHELRTPLTAIRGSLGLITGGAVNDSGKVVDMVGMALENTERVIVLVNDLLDFEKLDQGQLDFHMEKISLNTVVTDSIVALKPIANEKRIKLEFQEDASDVYITGDSGRLAQVMGNLLSNAIKYSHNRASVVVSLDCQDGRVRVAVTDQGPGVPDEFKNQMFERFTQADASDTRQKGGTGLGLSIAKTIIEKHGGTIALDPKTVTGAKFYFMLPLWNA